MTMGLRVSFAGNLTREPELRYTQSGRAIARFGVAINRRWRDREDNWQEAVEFVNCKMWGEQAEHFCGSEGITKGTRIIVYNGRLDTETWTDREGQERKDMICTVDEAGPSLRWATAAVAKTARGDAPPRTQGGAPAPSLPQPSAQPSAQPAGSPVPAGGFDLPADDDVPF